jgi:CubicO group peptidase (beta-lactamase class C family)
MTINPLLRQICGIPVKDVIFFGIYVTRAASVYAGVLISGQTHQINSSSYPGFKEMRFIMKETGLTSIFLIITFFSFSQQQNKISYSQLKEYEGIYEYPGHLKVSFAASPKDTSLVAIINQSEYKLKNESPDVFSSKYDSIHFLRDVQQLPSAYISKKDTFKLVSKNVYFPETMWYPRLKGKDSYCYTVPEDLNDGLIVGDINNTLLDTALLREMMQKIIGGTYQNVHSVLIIKDGKLVFEQYFYQYTKDSVQELRSATKSIFSALTGIAIDKGLIKSIKETALSFFPEYTLSNMSNGKKRITVENLLTQQTGLDCDISNGQSAGNETVMDYSDDWVKFTLDLPMIDTPGGKGLYCSGNPVTLGRIVEKTAGVPLLQFATRNLFEPLGFKNYKWNFKPDKSNAEDYCQVYLTPREMSKFGLLYLDKGGWNGKQIVSSDWVRQSFEKHSVIQGVDYGYLWWLKYLDAGGVRYYSKGAQGNGGQRIFVFPEENMVTVITGGNYNSQSPSDELVSKYILTSFNKK